MMMIHLTKTFQMLMAKKVMQHNFKLTKLHASKICELCRECEEKRDIRPHDKREAMYYDKAGSLFVLYHSASCKICLWEEKLSLC